MSGIMLGVEAGKQNDIAITYLAISLMILAAIRYWPGRG